MIVKTKLRIKSRRRAIIILICIISLSFGAIYSVTNLEISLLSRESLGEQFNYFSGKYNSNQELLFSGSQISAEVNFELIKEFIPTMEEILYNLTKTEHSSNTSYVLMSNVAEDYHSKKQIPLIIANNAFFERIFTKLDPNFSGVNLSSFSLTTNSSNPQTSNFTTIIGNKDLFVPIEKNYFIPTIEYLNETALDSIPRPYQDEEIFFIFINSNLVSTILNIQYLKYNIEAMINFPLETVLDIGFSTYPINPSQLELDFKQFFLSFGIEISSISGSLLDILLQIQRTKALIIANIRYSTSIITIIFIFAVYASIGIIQKERIVSERRFIQANRKKRERIFEILVETAIITVIGSFFGLFVSTLVLGFNNLNVFQNLDKTIPIFILLFLTVSLSMLRNDVIIQRSNEIVKVTTQEMDFFPLNRGLIAVFPLLSIILLNLSSQINDYYGQIPVIFMLMIIVLSIYNWAILVSFGKIARKILFLFGSNTIFGHKLRILTLILIFQRKFTRNTSFFCIVTTIITGSLIGFSVIVDQINESSTLSEEVPIKIIDGGYPNSTFLESIKKINSVQNSIISVVPIPKKNLKFFADSS
jgi:hypothetical protein